MENVTTSLNLIHVMKHLLPSNSKNFNPSWKKVAFTIGPNCLFVLCVYSFNCVMNRPGLRAVLSEKFLEVFGWFETELENVQKIYESQKVK